MEVDHRWYLLGALLLLGILPWINHLFFLEAHLAQLDAAACEILPMACQPRSRSCYLASFHGSTTCFSWKLIWRSWAPPRVKFFQWLANQDRCWTAERLARHGLQHHPRCPLCDQAPETLQHLLLQCPLARQAWYEILAWLRMTTRPPDQEASLMDWWQHAKANTAKPMRKGLASITLLIPWMIWKHRNECIFDGAQPSALTLISKIKEEAELWARAGAKGLRVVLPSTWDVH
jgi:hypothetical protein